MQPVCYMDVLRGKDAGTQAAKLQPVDTEGGVTIPGSEPIHKNNLGLGITITPWWPKFM